MHRRHDKLAQGSMGSARARQAFDQAFGLTIQTVPAAVSRLSRPPSNGLRITSRDSASLKWSSVLHLRRKRFIFELTTSRTMFKVALLMMKNQSRMSYRFFMRCFGIHENVDSLARRLGCIWAEASNIITACYGFSWLSCG